MNKFNFFVSCGVLCAIGQLALAGGVEVPPAGHSSLFIGVGGAYDVVQYKDTATESLNLFGRPVVVQASEDNGSVFGLSPVGQLGYEYVWASGGFLGIKGLLFNFVDKNTSYNIPTIPLFIGFLSAPADSTSPTAQAIVQFQSMLQTMVEGGIRINNNAFYLEAGYSALFAKSIIRNVLDGGLVLNSENQTLNGGVIGLGYRHYFWDVLFIDAAYTYSLYADASQLMATEGLPLFILPATKKLGAPGSTLSTSESMQLKQVGIQDIILSINYAFNF